MPTGTPDIQQINTALFSLLWNCDGMQALVGTHPINGQPQIYYNKGPQYSTYPMCVYSWMGGAPKKGGGAKKIFTKATYKVLLATTDTTLTNLFPVYNALELLLQMDQTKTNEVFIGITIDDYLSFTQEDEGVDYQFLGFQLSCMAYNNNTQFLSPPT